MSEHIITIHKTPHVACQGTEAEALALGLLVGAHEANVKGTENGLALKTKVDAPKPVHTQS